MGLIEDFMNSSIDIIGRKWEEDMPTILHDVNGVFVLEFCVCMCVWFVCECECFWYYYYYKRLKSWIWVRIGENSITIQCIVCVCKHRYWIAARCLYPVQHVYHYTVRKYIASLLHVYFRCVAVTWIVSHYYCLDFDIDEYICKCVCACVCGGAILATTLTATHFVGSHTRTFSGWKTLYYNFSFE